MKLLMILFDLNKLWKFPILFRIAPLPILPLFTENSLADIKIFLPFTLIYQIYRINLSITEIFFLPAYR